MISVGLAEAVGSHGGRVLYRRRVAKVLPNGRCPV